MATAALTRRVDHDTYAEATEKNSFHGGYTTDSVIVTLSIALALYNSLEMVLLIFSTFKKWKGLYFWSLSICNLGVLLYALGIMLGYFDLCVQWLNLTILNIGWVAMIACQSLVLYSRLGLILNNYRIQLGVLWMIIVDSIILFTLVLLFNYGSTYSRNPTFAEGYYYIEQIQLIIFTVQELIISGLYVWKTLGMLKTSLQSNTRTMVWQLFTINVIIICMDIAIVALEYLHFQLYQEAIKGFVYSVKLKLEVNILSKLVALVASNKTVRSMTLDIIDSSAIAGQAQKDVQRELNKANPFSDPIERNEKNVSEKQNIEEGIEPKSRSSGSSTQQRDDGDGITRVFSHNSRMTARTVGRETDMMYADFMQSMK